MKSRFAADGIDGADFLSGLDLVARLDIDVLYLALEGEIVTVLYQYALMVTRKDRYLSHNPVEDSLHFRIWRHGDIHAVVAGHIEVLEHRVILLAEQ